MKMKLQFVLALLVMTSGLEAQSVSFSKKTSGQTDVHLVSTGETLYSLSKRYHTSVEALLNLNPDITNNNLVQGKFLRVPIVKNETWAAEDHSAKKMDNPLLHKVEKSETVYSISKKFNTDVATILMWNDLKDPAIKEGQELIVGYDTPSLNVMGPLPAEDISTSTDKSPSSATNTAAFPSAKKEESDALAVNENHAKEDEVLHTEKGIALWTRSTYDDGNFYALHATAPAGTEITVRNLMNNKTVTVKVIGRLPATGDNEGMLIKLSESAARKLNVLDEKFLVEINYKAPADALALTAN